MGLSTTKSANLLKTGDGNWKEGNWISDFKAQIANVTETGFVLKSGG